MSNAPQYSLCLVISTNLLIFWKTSIAMNHRIIKILYKESLQRSLEMCLSRLMMVCVFVFLFALIKSIKSMLAFLKKDVVAKNHRVLNIHFKKILKSLKSLYRSSEFFCFSISLIESFKITISFLQKPSVAAKSRTATEALH